MQLVVLYASKKFFIADKRMAGFMKHYTEIDKILLGEKTKIISKIYKILLKEYTADESIKTQMVKWAET